MKSEQKIGWAVAIKRKDGTEYLAFGAHGTVAIWNAEAHKQAATFVNDLGDHGIRCRVVKVKYSDPEIIQ